jgi:signal peptidase II
LYRRKKGEAACLGSVDCFGEAGRKRAEDVIKLLRGESMARLYRAILVVAVVAGCVAVDQATKSMARVHLQGSGERSLVGGALKLDFTKNRGGTFSFERLLPPQWRGAVAGAAVAAVAGALALVLMVLPRVRPFTVFAWSLFMGGSLGNLLDRVAWSGDVVDFLELGWGRYRTCLFNVADIAVVAGVSLAVVELLWHAGTSKTGAPVPLQG